MGNYSHPFCKVMRVKMRTIIYIILTFFSIFASVSSPASSSTSSSFNGVVLDSHYIDVEFDSIFSSKITGERYNYGDWDVSKIYNDIYNTSVTYTFHNLKDVTKCLNRNNCQCDRLQLSIEDATAVFDQVYNSAINEKNKELEMFRDRLDKLLIKTEINPDNFISHSVAEYLWYSAMAIPIKVREKKISENTMKMLLINTRDAFKTLKRDIEQLGKVDLRELVFAIWGPDDMKLLNIAIENMEGKKIHLLTKYASLLTSLISTNDKDAKKLFHMISEVDVLLTQLKELKLDFEKHPLYNPRVIYAYKLLRNFFLLSNDEIRDLSDNKKISRNSTLIRDSSENLGYTDPIQDETIRTAYEQIVLALKTKLNKEQCR